MYSQDSIAHLSIIQIWQIFNPFLFFWKQNFAHNSILSYSRSAKNSLVNHREPMFNSREIKKKNRIFIFDRGQLESSSAPRPRGEQTSYRAHQFNVRFLCVEGNNGLVSPLSFKYSRVTVLIARRVLPPSVSREFIARLLKIRGRTVVNGRVNETYVERASCSSMLVVHGAPSTWLLHAPLIPFYFPRLVSVSTRWWIPVFRRGGRFHSSICYI